MKSFIIYLKDYFRAIPITDFVLTTFFVAILIVLNYTVGIERSIKAVHPAVTRLVLFYLLYLFVFSTAYWIHGREKSSSGSDPDNSFRTFLLVAPLYFAVKMVPWKLGTGNLSTGAANALLLFQLPLRLLLLLILLFFARRYTGQPDTFFGLSFRNFNPGPYLALLGILVPLVIFASTQSDFLRVYPKVMHAGLQRSSGISTWIWSLLYEISYGIDFVSIELFFRGFLVLAFIPYAGIHCILPMAAFYCSVHFGKPLGECISSYFGGLVLGVIASRTRLITGGLLIHLGIAWLMELGGYLGHLYINSRP